MTDKDIFNKLRDGCVIPAHPLALQADNKIDEPRQKALTRYYLAAGAGGLAVGVHTTQFAIHNPETGLYKPVLELAAETAKNYTSENNLNKPVMIAGIVGATHQAIKEAQLAKEMGYHIGLLSLTALRDQSITKLIEHAKAVSQVIPIMGFYLQETISKMVLPMEFWLKLLELPGVCAVKVAPFNRYQSLDVLEAVARCGRKNEVAIYTGNDDNIICDLLTEHKFNIDGREVCVRFNGGLLGQWACWTKRAVEYLQQIKQIRQSKKPVPQEMLTLATQLTLANKAIFDADNHFTGCIPGISYVLQQQGLIDQPHCLDSHEKLSPSQAERIDYIIQKYPHLTDNNFVQENLNE